MRYTLFALILCALSLSADRQPNVIVIFTDDQGSVDLNCYGAKDLTTPHMDSLAKRGVRFTQFYAAAPVCSPSRAGLLTGRYPVRAGMPGNAGSNKGRPGLAPDEVTIAETFKAAGYATAHIGKWHLGYTPETMPNGQDEVEFMESLVEMVEKMRDIVENVAKSWRGLGLQFDEDVRVTPSAEDLPKEGDAAPPPPTTTKATPKLPGGLSIFSSGFWNSSMNQDTRATLDSNEQVLLLQSRMESEMHAIRSEANKHNQEVAEKHRQLEAALAEERRRREVAETELRAEIDAKVAKLKSFLGEVCKKLPRPQRVNVSRKWLGTRVVVKLVFVCPRTDKELEVESSDWSLWLKFAWSIVQAGNPLELVQDIVGTVDTVRDMVETAYAAYHEVDNAQTTLDAMRTDPILLPSEEEKLIQGLRDAKFYDSFTYDDQTAEWFAT